MTGDDTTFALPNRHVIRSLAKPGAEAALFTSAAVEIAFNDYFQGWPGLTRTLVLLLLIATAAWNTMRFHKAWRSHRPHRTTPINHERLPN